MIFAEGDTSSTEVFTNPATWFNLGVAGIILGLFISGRLFSKAAVDELKVAQAVAIEKLETQIARLVKERDRALEERDEAIDVVKDFTHTAATLLAVDTPQRRTPARRRPIDDG